MLKVPFSLQGHLQGGDGPYAVEHNAWFQAATASPPCAGRGPGTSESKFLF